MSLRRVFCIIFHIIVRLVLINIPMTQIFNMTMQFHLFIYLLGQGTAQLWSMVVWGLNPVLKSLRHENLFAKLLYYLPQPQAILYMGKGTIS